MSTFDIRKPLLNPYLALGLAILGAASMVYYHQGLFIPRSKTMLAARGLGNGYSFGNDFYQVWLTSRALSEKQNPYSPEMTKEIQVGLYGRPLDPNRASDPVDQRAFPYPAFTDLLFWPVCQLPFTIVRIAILCALLALTIAAIPLWVQAMGWNLHWTWIALISGLTLSSYPALEGLFAGQLGLLVSFLLAATLFSLRRERFLAAGILLGLAAMKPQSTLLVTLYLLLWAIHQWNQRKSFVVGLLATDLLLLGASLVILPHWISSWLGTVLAYSHYTTPRLIREVIPSFLPDAVAGPTSFLLTIIAVVLSLLLIFQSRKSDLRSSEFWLTFSLLLSVTAVVLLPGQAVYDHLILVPALLVIWQERYCLYQSGRVSRLLLALVSIVFLWPWVTAACLLLLRLFATRAVFNSPVLLSLPIRTAASLPFAVLAALVWIWLNRRERKAAS